jgi:hypothetical protein
MSSSSPTLGVGRASVGAFPKTGLLDCIVLLV